MMQRLRRTLPAFAAVSCVLPMILAGCGTKAGRERFYPAPQPARAAVEAALNDWQQGKPARQIDGLSPQVSVIDTHRKPGQRLVGFEILGEVAGDGPRRFAVTLKLTSPESEEKARYVVVGIDPLWVFRQEDFDMLAHWDHVMPGEDRSNGKGKVAEVKPADRGLQEDGNE